MFASRKGEQASCPLHYLSVTWWEKNDRRVKRGGKYLLWYKRMPLSLPNPICAPTLKCTFEQIGNRVWWNRIKSNCLGWNNIIMETWLNVCVLKGPKQLEICYSRPAVISERTVTHWGANVKRETLCHTSINTYFTHMTCRVSHLWVHLNSFQES